MFYSWIVLLICDQQGKCFVCCLQTDVKKCILRFRLLSTPLKDVNVGLWKILLRRQNLCLVNVYIKVQTRLSYSCKMINFINQWNPSGGSFALAAECIKKYIKINPTILKLALISLVCKRHVVESFTLLDPLCGLAMKNHCRMGSKSLSFQTSETPGLQRVPRGQKLRKQRNPWEGTRNAASLFTASVSWNHRHGAPPQQML